MREHGADPAGASQGVEEGFRLSPHVWFFGVLVCFLLWFSLRISVFLPVLSGAIPPGRRAALPFPPLR